MIVWAIIILGILLIFCLCFLIVLSYNIIFLWLFPLFMGGAFFATTNDALVEKMVRLANIQPTDKAVDIGSGDGRLVIAMAQAGAEAHGYEINPFLVFMSKRKIRKAGLEGKAFIHLSNFWKEDFSKYNIVSLFQIAHTMEKLEGKLKKELRPGSKIVSNYFVFNGIKPAIQEDTIRLYIL